MVSLDIAVEKPRYTHADMQHIKQVKYTRLVFFALCGYLLSQAFQIPIRATGPSWAIWPTFSDLFAGMLFALYFIGRRWISIPSRSILQIYRSLQFICGAVFLVIISKYVITSISDASDVSRVNNFGVFQLYRMVQFTLIFRIAAGIPLTPSRQKTLLRVATIALLGTIAGVIGTYTSLIKTSSLVGHLPSDFGTAGPWAYLAKLQMFEVGAIGYNHAYTAIQIIMLAGIRQSLQTRPDHVKDMVFLSLCVIGIFLTGSRAGLAAMLLIMGVYVYKKPVSLTITFILMVILFIGAGGLFSNPDMEFTKTVERQFALGNPLDADTLSGRQDIWKVSVEFLQENPIRWIVGAGPGTVALMNTNAHMLYLHIVMESGLIGLLVFGSLFYPILRHLRRYEFGTKPILWTSIALLITSLTQETFYPIPAFGHFLGLYLCSLVIALKVKAPPV